MPDKIASKGSAENPFSKDQLVSDLRQLGLKKGDLLHAKVSLRSLGRVEGGAATLVEAILEVLGLEGTLVSDSFVLMYPLPLSADTAQKISEDNTATYAGAFCTAMINHPLMVRSKHPILKGVAIGARAKDLMLSHTHQSPAYDPLHRMAQEGAKHISIDKNVVGVGTTHVAQNLLGLKQNSTPSGINYRNTQGEIVLFQKNWVGGCGDGFPKFFPLYEEHDGIISRGKVGLADSVITYMKITLEVEMEKLASDPGFFFCDDPACTYCRLSWDFSKGKVPIVLFTRFMKSLRQESPRALANRVIGRLGRHRRA